MKISDKILNLNFRDKLLTELSKRCIFIVLLFLVNPFLGVFVMIFFTMLYCSKEVTWLKLLLFLLALFMGLIQSTRIIKFGEASDWPMYMDYFSEANNKDLLTYMQSGYMRETTKEPAYRIINYLGFHIFAGNFTMFAASLVFVMYFSFYQAIYKFWKASYTDVRLLIAAIVLFTFITENFAITNNLFRQQFAMGIMSYVIALKVVEKKMNWWLAVFAGFTHTLMFVYLAILFIKPLYDVIRPKYMLWFCVIFLIGGFIMQRISFFAGLFSFSDTLSYGFNRASKLGLPYELTDVIDNRSVYYNIGLFLLVTLKLNYLDAPINRSQIFYTNLLFFLFVLCAVFNFAPLLQTRFYISRFFLMPFVVPFLFHRHSVINGIYLWSIVVFFCMRFLISFDHIHGGSFFPSINNLVSNSVFHYFF
jgi:hypothetical protein